MEIIILAVGIALVVAFWGTIITLFVRFIVVPIVEFFQDKKPKLPNLRD
jgi:large-conductance mechanosensitive channel